MEWNRAKTILIFSFLVLNVLLAYQLWTSRQEMSRSSADTAELTQEIMQMLKTQGVELHADVPTATPKLQEITVNLSANPVTKPVPLAQPVPSAGIAQTNRQLQAALASQIPNIREFQLDNSMSTDQVLMFHQLYQGYPLFDVNLLVYRHNGRFDSYQMSYVKDVQVQSSDQSDQAILSGMTAIGSLVGNNHLPSGAIITQVELGYHGQIFNSETQVLAPAWRIETQRSGTFYVQAITGGVMSDTKETQTHP